MSVPLKDPRDRTLIHSFPTLPATHVSARLLKIVYLLTCRVLGAVSLVFRDDRAKTAELLVLRHQNAVLRRHVSRGRYRPRLTGYGSPRWRGSFPGGAGQRSSP
jgi:hypothetical protein